MYRAKTNMNPIHLVDLNHSIFEKLREILQKEFLWMVFQLHKTETDRKYTISGQL